MPEYTILSRTPSAYVNAERKLVETTFVVFKDKDGRVGTIVIHKAKPSDTEVEAEIKKREAAR